MFKRRVKERFDLLPALIVPLHFNAATIWRDSNLSFLVSRKIGRLASLANQAGSSLRATARFKRIVRARQINFAHPTCAERRKSVVVTEARVGVNRHLWAS